MNCLLGLLMMIVSLPLIIWLLCLASMGFGLIVIGPFLLICGFFDKIKKGNQNEYL